MKFRGGPAAVIGDVGDKGAAQTRRRASHWWGPPRWEGRLRRTIREPEDLLDLIHEDEIRWKGFRQALAAADVLHCASEKIVKKSPPTPAEVSKKPRPDVIAIRKTCDAEGTGLSHYVLMDKQVKR